MLKFLNSNFSESLPHPEFSQQYCYFSSLPTSFSFFLFLFSSLLFFLAINCVSCSYTHKFHFEMCRAFAALPRCPRSTTCPHCLPIGDPQSFPKRNYAATPTKCDETNKNTEAFSKRIPTRCMYSHTHTQACRDTCVCVCGMYSMYVMYPGECERRMRIRHRTGPRPRMSVQCDCEYSSYTRRQRCDVDAG